MNERIDITAVALLALTGLTAPGLLMAQDDPEQDLARLRGEIVQLERELDEQIDRRDDGMAELKAIETSLGETRAELASLGRTIEAQSEARERIEAERAESAQSLAAERSALDEQVRMSYMTGRQELIRLLLSEENPAELGRMLVYYDYLNRHRSERIAAVGIEVARLEDLTREADDVRVELEELRTAEETEARRLERAHGERAALLDELDAGIESSEQRIERMRAEEAQLNEVVTRLAELLEGFPVSSEEPFSAQKGALRWPIDGRLVAGFGDFRDTEGRVRWDGVLLEADAGTLVRAVYQGRVVHSQWTPGMGLLLIVDHGEGYLTLYGHNAVLLKEPGDWVAPGEAIAEVGDTGGQLGTALYFAVRQDGEAIDPADWIR